MSKLVLFDIDGTLLDSGGAGIKALEQAMFELAGIRNGFAGIECAGKTDRSIIKEALLKRGQSADEDALGGFIARYVSYLKDTVFNDRGHVKQGVNELLAALSLEPDISVGLLTGNVEPGARIKLERFSLHHHFTVGAFGCDEEDRNKLLPIAVARHKDKHGLHVEYPDCLVIGDTPRDVLCAQVYGARSLAVATGPYSMEQLAPAAADLTLVDLTDTEEIMRWIKNHN